MKAVLVWAGIVLATTLATVLGYAMWVAAFNPPRHHSTNVEMFKDGQWTFRFDPFLGSAIIPGSHGRSHANGIVNDYYYGPYGNRISAPTDQTDPASELVMVGCSQAWGQGVKNEDVASSVIARTTGYRPLNLAAPGTGTVFAAKRLELRPELRPKVIVYLFYEDHLYRNLRHCAPMDNPLCAQLISARKDAAGHWSYRYPSYLLEPLLGGPHELIRRWYLDQYDGSGRTSYWKDVFWSLLDVYSRIYKLFHSDVHVSDPARRADVLGAFDFALQHIASYARARQARFIIAYVPLYNYPARLQPMPEDLRAVMEKNGAIPIDMSKPFNALIGTEPTGQGEYIFAIPHDGHLNALGHRMIAEEVLRVLKP